MGFLALLLLGGGTLLAFSAYRGTSPVAVLRAVLRGEDLPGPQYEIEAAGYATGIGAGVGDAVGDAAAGAAQFLGSFARPLSSWKVTSGYGMRFGRMHMGVDVPAPTGTPIRAAAAGVVDRAGYDPGGAGNRVNIKHNSTYLTKYFHMSRIAVRAGQKVSQGQVIGYVGSTGRSSGPHLHFEVWKNGNAVNPTGYVK